MYILIQLIGRDIELILITEDIDEAYNTMEKCLLDIIGCNSINDDKFKKESKMNCYIDKEKAWYNGICKTYDWKIFKIKDAHIVKLEPDMIPITTSSFLD